MPETPLRAGGDRNLQTALQFDRYAVTERWHRVRVELRKMTKYCDAGRDLRQVTGIAACSLGSGHGTTAPPEGKEVAAPLYARWIEFG